MLLSSPRETPDLTLGANFRSPPRDNWGYFTYGSPRLRTETHGNHLESPLPLSNLGTGELPLALA